MQDIKILPTSDVCLQTDSKVVLHYVVNMGSNVYGTARELDKTAQLVMAHVDQTHSINWQCISGLHCPIIPYTLSSMRDIGSVPEQYCVSVGPKNIIS